MSSDSQLAELGPAECWDLLRTTSIGRLATGGSGPLEIFPINFVVDRESIVFRSAPGSKLMALTDQPLVAFESDGQNSGGYWSVVLRGPAQRLGMDEEIEASGALSLESVHPTEKNNYVRISPATITGRRFGKVPRRDEDAGGTFGPAATRRALRYLA